MNPSLPCARPGRPLARLLALALALTAPLLAQAAYPDKPIRMVVPYAAGGGADNTARVLAQRLSEQLGQPVVIENKPGAGGVLGADAVAKAPADGYTVLYDASAFAVNAALRKLPFDPAKDFIPISLVAFAPQILVAPLSAPYKTVSTLVDYARRNPGKLSYASAGAGSGSHLAAELFNDQARVELVHVPYKGGAPALTDVIGGQVDLYFGNVASTLNYVKTGKLQALAVSARKRVPGLPQLPTLIESGIEKFDVQEWNAVFLPKGTPADIVQRWGREVPAAVATPQVNERLQQMGLDPVGNTPPEFSRFLQAESARWQALVKARQIKVD